MKKIFFVLAAIFVLVCVLSLSLTGCDNSVTPSASKSLSTPTAADYDITGLTQTAGNITAVIITPKPGKLPGVVTAIYYEGTNGNYAKSKIQPTAAGIYIVTFDVEAAPGWNAASGIFAGTLNINANMIKTLIRIAVTVQPRTQYNFNEDLDIADMTVTAFYSDGSEETITGYDTTGYNKTIIGNQIITVRWQGKTAEFTVNVIDPIKPTVAAPTANPAGGTVAGGLTVTLSTATADAEIWYTVNGSTPAKNGAGSTRYTTPIAITAATTIKAVAVKDGMNDSGTLEAIYTDMPITSAEIIITAPVKGGVPAARASGDVDSFTAGAVIWSPADNPFLGDTVYAATVTLTAASGYTFTGLITAKVNGQNATVSNNTGEAVTLSHAFAKTLTKTVSSIAVKSPPTRSNYTHGEALDLSGMVITLSYDDSTTEDVTAADFTTMNITVDPANGSRLIRSTHNGNPITITYGSLPLLTTGYLTVNPKNTSVLNIDEIEAQTYTGGGIEPAITVKDGAATLEFATDYTVSYSNNTNAGTATVTITGAGNYTGIKTADFTINPKDASNFTIDAIAAHTYTGSAFTPTVTARDGDKTLVKDTDYTVSYIDNTNAGTAKVTVTGAGNYAGTKTVSFIINKTDPLITTWPSAAAISLGAALSASALSGGVHTTPGSFAWTAPATVPDSVGTHSYSVTFTPADTNNYNTAASNINITVNVPPNYSISLSRGRSVTIDMYDSSSDGWNGNGALRINVNGVDIATNIKVQSGGATNTYTLNVTTGDVVQLYWVAGTYQSENSFIVYYTDTPPSPAFTSSNNNNWSGSNALVYKKRGEMTSIGNGSLLGSFTGTQATMLTGTHTFTTAIQGYTAPAALSVNVTNTGNSATGTLTAALSGTNADSFTLSTTSINDIAVDGAANNAFTVQPKTGLVAGTHTATVTVSGSNNITAGFNVSFTVVPPYEYIITGSGTSFTATRNGTTVGTANTAIQTVIDGIKTNANGNAVKIQFGDGTNTLDIGTATAAFTGADWGLVTLTGKITSSASSSGTVSTNYVSVISTADIANTNDNDIYAIAVSLNSSFTFNISGGTILATKGRAVYNSSGTVNISGGTVSATTGTAVLNGSHANSPGTVNISGGTVSATMGRAVHNNAGTVNISGGTVSATTGIAVYDYYDSKGITVSGTAQITSANVTAAEGTIYLVQHPNPLTTTTRLTISGGTVSNTALSGGRAVYNEHAGQITINSGTVQAAGIGGYAIMNTNVNSSLYLSSPTIIGLIRPSAAGKLSVGSYLGNGPYVLDYASYNNGDIAVTNGASYLSSFMLYNQPNLQLTVNGNNLVVSIMSNSNDYIISGSGTSFTATKGGTTIGTANTAIQTVIDGIRTHANGGAATIQFYNGSNALNIGMASAQFSGNWGAVTLGGRITSSVSTSTTGTIHIGGGVSVTSTAEIANTNENNSAKAVYFNSTGTLTISGGTVTAAARAIYNAGSGTINISGGTVSTGNGVTETSAAVTNADYGTINISGGMVLTTHILSVSVGNSGPGNVNISGGTVSSEDGSAVANSSSTGSSGKVTISGGTVSSTNARAVICSTGKTIVSGTALVTSANDVASSSGYSIPGTIDIRGGELEITGGTVENTANYQSARTLYLNSGTVSISGGTVRAQSGIAVYNASNSSKITVSGTALVTSPHGQGTIYLAPAQSNTTVQLEVTGGNIRNTTNSSSSGNAYANAIYHEGNGTITVTGGIVQSKTGRAILGTDMSLSMLNFSGGVLFSYYSYYHPGDSLPVGIVTVNAESNATLTRIYGNWTYYGTSRTYTAGTSTDIIASPTTTGLPASGVWAKNGSRSGINFTRNGVTTFVEVNDVTVN